MEKTDFLSDLEKAPDWALFDEHYAAAARNISLSVIRQDRLRGTGIPVTRQGRKVLYRKSDIMGYLAGLNCNSIPEARPAYPAEVAA